jgi:hypothetical protein
MYCAPAARKRTTCPGEVGRGLRDAGLQLRLSDLALEELLAEHEDVVGTALDLVQSARIEERGLGKLQPHLLHDREVGHARRHQRRRRIHARAALCVIEPAGERRRGCDTPVLPYVHGGGEPGFVVNRAPYCPASLKLSPKM